MPDSHIAHLRLRSQMIAPQANTSPEAVVRALGAMQGQDYRQALWGIGLRSGAGIAAVEATIQRRAIVRTHLMHGTLHLVAAEDLAWILSLTRPRMLRTMSPRHVQLGLDEATLAQSSALMQGWLRESGELDRAGLLARLDAAGISTAGGRGYHMLAYASICGLIAQTTETRRVPRFFALDTEAEPAPPREEALATLAARYFAGHGPASIQDFVWWTGLTVGEAREALEGARARGIVAHGEGLWGAPDDAPASGISALAQLMPAFDEYLLGYRSRDAMLDPAFAGEIVPGGNGVFRPMIVIDGEIRGTWAQQAKRGGVVLTLRHFRPPSAAEREALDAAATRFGDFIGLPASAAP
jgi:hypothetical protein